MEAAPPVAAVDSRSSEFLSPVAVCRLPEFAKTGNLRQKMLTNRSPLRSNSCRQPTVTQISLPVTVRGRSAPGVGLTADVRLRVIVDHGDFANHALRNYAQRGSSTVGETVVGRHSKSDCMSLRLSDQQAGGDSHQVSATWKPGRDAPEFGAGNKVCLED